MITYPFNLDMVPGGKQPVVRINQYDSDFRLAFSLFARKGEFELESGTEASIRGTKPDGNVYTATCDIDIESKLVTITGDVQITAVAGESTFEIVLTKDGEELSSANFPIIVEKAAANKDTIQSDSVVRELVAVLDKSDEIIAAGAQYAEYKTEIESAMASANSIKRDAEAAEDNARDYARRASESATAAGRKADAAAEYANDADKAKEAAVTSANDAAKSAEAFVVDSTFTQAGAAADAKAVGDALETKAKIDGSYESMTVGNAEQLVSSRYTVDNEPYLYRTSGGTADIGDREYDEIVGGSVVWNQLADYSGAITRTVNGVTFTNNNDGSWDISGTATADIANANVGRLIQLQNNAVYLVRGCPLEGSKSTYSFGIGGLKMDYGSGTIWRNSKAYESGAPSFLISENVEVNFTKVKPQIFNLTKMFGSEIADYVYNLEQTTPGAGVAWFRKYFPKDYYEYNAGELKHVEGLTAHEMVGFNLWDEEWEVGTYDTVTGTKTNSTDRIRCKSLIPVLPNTKYFISTPATLWFMFFDSDDKIIEGYVTGKSQSGNACSASQSVIITPPNCAGMVFYALPSYGTTYNHDININLSWSGWRDGEYEPYVKHSYPLDPSLTLRGVPKLSADGKLYFDGDRYASDGTVTRRYGLVDLGRINWIADVNNIFRANTPGYKLAGLCLCMKYKCVQKNSYNVMVEGELSITNSQSQPMLRIKDSSYTDAASFKAAMSGVWLLYELAAPTTETALAYQSPQIVDDFGTEEYVSTGIVPVGHETKYLANLRDKIQHLPDLADDDGYYVIQQTGHDMSLVHFRIPQAPTTDGTYTLKATVTGGAPTYTWEGVTDNG